MCFVWILEQTAIISLHTIYWLVFIPEECVYCAVRADSWYKADYVVFKLKTGLTQCNETNANGLSYEVY